MLAVSAYDWPQFGLNSQHTSNNTLEATLNAGNVHSLQRFLRVALPDIADGAPAFLFGVKTSGGLKDLIFVTTKSGEIMALDWRTGATVWSHLNDGGPNYTTSSPAVDPNRAYVYSYGLDGYVHKYRVGDGLEITTGGWPELATFKPAVEKGSSALSIATAANGTSYLYVTNGGYPGDAGNYQGHVTAINLSNGSQNVFNTMCSDQAVHFKTTSPDCAGLQSAIWARPGVIYDAATDKIYMATGNGTFDPANHDWGDTVFALNPDGTGAGGAPLDSFTPTNFQDLQDQDTDIGSTAPALLPNASKYRHLAVQGGKDARLRLLNLDNLSGQGAPPGHTGGEVFSMTVPQGGEILTQPAVWINPADNATWVFVANGSGLSGLKLIVDSGNNPSLESQWNISRGGSSPIVANGVLYYASDNNLWALNPVSALALWHATNIGPIHWESPIVVNGLLYLTDESNFLNGYSLNGAVPGLLTQTFLPFIAR